MTGVTESFALTYDYLCPFARNVNEAVVEMIRQGDDLDVSFVPFSLAQNHMEEGEVAQWDLDVDDVGSGVLALLWSLAVRDEFADHFFDFHVTLFAARHDDARDISDVAVLTDVTRSVGLDAAAVAAAVADGSPARTLAVEHMDLVEAHDVFGVPTFVQGDEAVFVRLMERHAYSDIRKVIEMLSWVNFNEFKRTTVGR